MKPFGALLRDERKKAGLTQESLAEAAGNVCTGSYISLIEQSARPGKNPKVGKKGRLAQPDMLIVDALARVLKIPLQIARPAAGYAAPEIADRPEEISLANDFSLLFGNYERLNPFYRNIARKLFVGILNNLYEVQLGAISGNELFTPLLDQGLEPDPENLPVLYPATEVEIDRAQTLREQEKNGD